MSIAALIAGLLAGIIGSMGLGGGAVLIIYLALFTSTEQLAAQGINLIFFLPIGAVSVIIYSCRRLIEWRLVLSIAAGGLAGAVAGIMLTDLLGGNITAKIFGGLLIILGVREIFAKSPKQT